MLAWYAWYSKEKWHMYLNVGMKCMKYIKEKWHMFFFTFSSMYHFSILDTHFVSKLLSEDNDYIV